MNYEEIYEGLLEAIDDLAEANRSAPILVEGDRDVRSLRDLGLAGEIVPLNSGVPVFNLAEALARRHRKVVLLTDWDRRGGQLCRQLRDAFEANGVRPDVELRARITFLSRKDIKDVESLAAFVERVSRQVEGGWHGKESKRWYSQRKSGAVQQRRSRRILASRRR